ncbi:organic hydroperoxide resistance protein [Corynebacterium minutissimum]|uniref:organic hydroperoxide resistance protein n=1 Tax=Corynebacterium minutissimum TaxID=38301 RepID=UPI001EF172E4|nr:organic hydroperoxide resistance protein [Corynebacterium minutissimum]MCG7229491.1 organic hydroperoxide resistance protein [Corynebacterium minutissimum]MCG7239218.1 organic hydroperoxide resistance protein [Corynebacterium minutissimum]
MTAAYTTEALSTGAGRDGRTIVQDSDLDFTMTAPKEMCGSGEGVNPEQLFAAGYAACFHSALKAVAKDKDVDVTDSAVGARVTLNNGSEGFFLSAELEVTIPGVDQEEAQALADAAHEMCPYSKATRGNIDVSVTVAED